MSDKHDEGIRDYKVSNRALDWTPADKRAVDLVRVLAMDAVQKTGNGHPGTAMSLAPAAYLLYQRILRHDPADPKWPGRDRFVLSAGHSSLTLYIQLYLSGYGVSLDDLKAFRTWGSITPGHPEYGMTPGVETTTGPLGQGLGNAVGMAMAARRERGLLDPDAAPGASPFDHFVYSIVSDGDIEEGMTHESSSIAAVQELGNLIVIYDDNRISIEDASPLTPSSRSPSEAKHQMVWSKRLSPSAASGSNMPRSQFNVSIRGEPWSSAISLIVARDT